LSTNFPFSYENYSYFSPLNFCEKKVFGFYSGFDLQCQFTYNSDSGIELKCKQILNSLLNCAQNWLVVLRGCELGGPLTQQGIELAGLLMLTHADRHSCVHQHPLINKQLWECFKNQLKNQ